jgi:uncharacterized membrane protein (UPF0127 family)
MVLPKKLPSYRMRSLLLVLPGALLCFGCGPKVDSAEDLNTLVVTLPDGHQIRTELLTKPAEIAHGMMYRDALPQDRGLLFIHDKPAPYRYFMSNVKAPLDIIFMDSHRQIVEISAETPPCTSKPASCPTYGGHYYEQFVLELRAGEAQRLGLHKGQTLSF